LIGSFNHRILVAGFLSLAVPVIFPSFIVAETTHYAENTGHWWSDLRYISTLTFFLSLFCRVGETMTFDKEGLSALFAIFGLVQPYRARP
jgi:hypothetical protein